MLYLTSKFHENRVNTFGFMEGGLFKPPQGPGTPKKPRPVGVKPPPSPKKNLAKKFFDQKSAPGLIIGILRY